MKKGMIVFFSCISYFANAQETAGYSESKNMVEWNVLGLTSSTISLQYERLLHLKQALPLRST